MRATFLAVLTLAALAVPAAAARPAQEVPPGAIAVVAGEPIPLAHFEALMARVRRGYRSAGRKFPPRTSREYRQLKDQAVRLLVQRAQYRQKAAQLGIAITDEQVDERLREIRRNAFGGSDRRLREALAKSGITYAEFREDLRTQLLSEAIYEAVTASATASDAEVDAYYASHQAQFRQPAMREVAHILVRTRARADWIYARIKAGASFAALARRYSLDPGSRNRGGRLTIGRGQTVKGFDRVAFSLRVGQVSRPVKTQFGWHVIKALSRIRPGRETPLEDVREPIRAYLVQTRRNELMNRWLEALKQEYAGKIVYVPGFEPGR